jgi:hypothetical protein
VTVQQTGAPGRRRPPTHVNRERIPAVVADIDCAVGKAPCLAASDDRGFSIDEAEVINRGLCPGCSTARSS